LKFVLTALGNWYEGWNLTQSAVAEADKLTFWGFLMPDHYMWGGEMGSDSTLDSWVALTYLAAKTNQIRLGTLVSPIPFRPPGLLAKVVSTLDVVSGGRAILGVGAGWSQAEFEGFSEWSEPRIRVDKTREGVELILRLWKEKKADFNGKYYRSRKAILEPKPIQKPHPPLLFAGFGPRMLRLAGRYADICLIPPVGWTELTRHNMRSIVEQEAVRLSRADKISFASAFFKKLVQARDTRRRNTKLKSRKRMSRETSTFSSLFQSGNMWSP